MKTLATFDADALRGLADGTITSYESGTPLDDALQRLYRRGLVDWVELSPKNWLVTVNAAGCTALACHHLLAMGVPPL